MRDDRGVAGKKVSTRRPGGGDSLDRQLLATADKRYLLFPAKILFRCANSNPDQDRYQATILAPISQLFFEQHLLQ